jgi:hypothetical protein
VGSEPILERTEIEDEACDHDAHAIDFRGLDHALALGGAQVFDEREYSTGYFIAAGEEMHHDDGPGSGHCVE